MTIVYRLLFDANDDFEPEEDLTQFLIHWHWIEGFEEDYDPVVGFGLLEFKLINDGRFDEGSTTYVRGRRIRFQADAGSGWVTQVEAVAADFVTVRERGRAVATLICERFMKELAEQDVSYSVAITVGTEATTGELMESVLRSIQNPVPAGGYFVLGLGRLDTASATFPPDTGVDVGEGRLQLRKAGGVWEADAKALEVIRDICSSERGRFWMGRDGTYTFRGRRYLMLENRTIQTSISDVDVASLDFVYPAQKYRRVHVRMSPRVYDDTVTVLGAIDEPILLKAAFWDAELDISTGRMDNFRLIPREHKVRIPYRDEDGARVRAFQVQGMQPSTDYIATRQVDSNGEAVGTIHTSALDVTVEDRGSAAHVVINWLFYHHDLWLSKLQVRGRAVRDKGTVHISHAESGVEGHWPELFIDAPLIDDPEEARRHGIYVARFFAEERGQVRWVEFERYTDSLEVAVVDRYLLDRVQVTFADYTDEYFIRKIEREVGIGVDRCRWYLELADVNEYMRLGGPGNGGMTSFWDFEDGEWEDRHGSNDLIAVNGVTTEAGIVGDAAAFDRDLGQGLMISDAGQTGLEGDGVFTVCLHFNLASLPSSWGTVTFGLVGKFGSAGSRGWVSYIYHGTDRVRFITSDDGTTLHVLDSTKVLSVGVTYGVIISYDGARMYLQVEDVEVSLAQAAGIQATSNAFEIGRHSGFAAFSFDGWIDQVAYFPRILSPLEKEYMLAGRAYSEVYVAGATQLDNAKLVW